MSVQKRRKYDPEFKKNAVLLAKELGHSVSDLSENPGIRINLLHRWRLQFLDNGEIAFPGQSQVALTQKQRRIRELEKNLKNAEMGLRCKRQRNLLSLLIPNMISRLLQTF